MKNQTTFSVSRFEEQGESLFICLNHTEKPVYLEHFFTLEEKLDLAGTIEKLAAELEVMADEYVAPLPRISKVEEAKAITLDSKKIASAKIEFLAKRELERNPKVEPLLEPLIP